MTTRYDESDSQPLKKQKVETMTFGKHNGKTVEEVPYNYVVWLLCGPNTTDKFTNGNYGWIKQNEPTLFKALKERFKQEIDKL